MSKRHETVNDSEVSEEERTRENVHRVEDLLLHSVNLFQPLKWTQAGHTYHMNQFFQVWPTSAIQTALCTYVKAFSVLGRNQLEHGTNRTWYCLCCDNEPRITHFFKDDWIQQRMLVQRPSGSPWQQVSPQPNRSGSHFTLQPPVKGKE